MWRRSIFYTARFARGSSVFHLILSLLQKARFAGDFLQREAKAEGAGGHFWHDEVLTQTP
jgi:hypothetical protein